MKSQIRAVQTELSIEVISGIKNIGGVSHTMPWQPLRYAYHMRAVVPRIRYSPAERGITHQPPIAQTPMSEKRDSRQGDVRPEVSCKWIEIEAHDHELPLQGQ